MNAFSFFRGAAGLSLALVTSGLGRAADDAPVVPTTKSASPGAPRTSASRSTAARGMLPDPALLDGSKQTPEKKSEYGMLGDFELPGDENVKTGKVGGQQNPNSGSPGGQSNNMPAGRPQGGGGQQSQQQGGGGQGGPQGVGQQAAGGGQQASGGTSGGPGGTPQNPNAAGNPVGGAGEPGAQPQGIQVAELGGNASGQQGGGAGDAGGKPQPVAIGDKGMRIDQAANAPGVVGAQQQQIADGHVQQHEKGTGTGGKGSSSPQGPGRIEKGRAIPSGL